MVEGPNGRGPAGADVGGTLDINCALCGNDRGVFRVVQGSVLEGSLNMNIKHGIIEKDLMEPLIEKDVESEASDSIYDGEEEDCMEEDMSDFEDDEGLLIGKLEEELSDKENDGGD